MATTYTEAFGKDVDKLLKQLKELNATLKKNPNDPAAKAAKAKLAPFLTKEALEKRYELAKKLDVQAMGAAIKTAGLPGW